MLTRRQLLTLLATPLLKKAGALSDPPGALLLQTTIAGYRHYVGPSIEPRLHAGRELLLRRREPSNPHDPNAIAILDRSEVKLAYLPRRQNEIPARLLDQRSRLTARVTAIRRRSAPWERIAFEVCPRRLIT
jgi:hypothetical protein